MKKRLDVILYERGLMESRERAKTTIMAGLVYVDGQRKDKAGEKVKEDVEIKIKEDPIPYVSRGGLKLEKALKEFDFDLRQKVIMDIGASTGGFTDCLLQNGAKKVFAIDVGYGQLAWKLRQHPKVISMERTNFRYLKLEEIGERVEAATIDVSFISLTIILKNLYGLLERDGEVIALIKPQFEVGREKVGKKGVVSDPKLHIEVIEKIFREVMEIGFFIKGLSYSPITGPAGNIEFLAHISKRENGELLNKSEKIACIVKKAHDELKNKKK